MNHFCQRLRIFLLVGFISIYHITAFASTAMRSRQQADSLAVEQTMKDFVTAFINLDWARFDAFFASDATAFFPPSAKVANRANNKMEIEKIFRNFFDNIRARKKAPPYLQIEPKNEKIQMFGNMAIVSFELEDPDLFGRRTIVLQKQSGKWLIEHLHASGIAIK